MLPKMRRIQLSIEPELAWELQKLALRRHISRAQLLREGVRRLLVEATPAEEDPIVGIIDLGHGGPGNVSRDHDKFLADWKLAKRRN